MRALTVLLIGSVPAIFLYGQQPAAGSIDYKKDVQPIFYANCTVCHKGAAPPSGLKLDSAAGVLRGGASGKVIVPGNSHESVLAKRISETDGNQMPPSGPLAKQEISTIIQWINEGAKADISPADLAAPQVSRVKRLQPTIAAVTD